MIKKILIGSIGFVIAAVVLFAVIIIFEENDLLDEISDIFSSKSSNSIVQTKNNTKNKTSKFNLFAPKVKITKNQAASVEYQKYDNGLFSMQIPKGWMVKTSKTDYIHYTFMVYDPKNPDFKIFFNMKTEGYLKTQKMKNFYSKYYPTAPMAKLPVISPQTTEAFYKIFTKAYNLSQNVLLFKVPVINNFKTIQTLGKNATGGQIIRATYKNELNKDAEGVFTTTIKEFAMPPVVLLISYNTIFFTTPMGELVDWMPKLNYCVSTIKFSNNFIDNYYKEQGQVVKSASALQGILNQTSNIITSGWEARQKTYDILSQKRSDATMGYERVQDTDTGEIYKADLDFMDKDWHGKYEKITDDMYNLPTAGYIEKR